MIDGFASGAAFWLAQAQDAALAALALAFLAAIIRAIRGPHLTDRLAALMLGWSLAIAAIALLALRTATWIYLDLALVLAVIGSAIPLSALLVARGVQRGSAQSPSEPDEEDLHARTD
jgi:multicomponent K+:H+ antiporter subunit F